MRKDIMISSICALSTIMLIQNAYAQTYEKESTSGKVQFQCELEVPENWNGEEIPKLILESVNFGDSEKVYANFVEGKEILEQHNIPASDLYPEENNYVLADGTNVGIGMEFGVSTKNSVYYAQIGVTNTENMEKFTSATESIVNDQDAVQKVKETLENAGYAVENLVFQTSSLSAEGIPEQVIEEAFIESYRMLCNDNKDVLEEFLKRTEKALGENSIGDQLHKLEKSIEKVSLKRKKLLDNYLKGIIEQDIYEETDVELKTELTNTRAKLEYLQQQSDEKSSLQRRLSDFKKALSHNEVLEEFDRGIFESIVEKVIVGGLDEDGNKDPYKITFIYKTGFKNEIGNAKERFGKSSGIGDKVKKMCSDISDEVKGVCSDVSLNTCGVRSIDVKSQRIE